MDEMPDDSETPGMIVRPPHPCPLARVQAAPLAEGAPESDPADDDLRQTVELARELLSVAVTLLRNACDRARERGEGATPLDELLHLAQQTEALARDGCDPETE